MTRGVPQGRLLFFRGCLSFMFRSVNDVILQGRAQEFEDLGESRDAHGDVAVVFWIFLGLAKPFSSHDVPLQLSHAHLEGAANDFG